MEKNQFSEIEKEMMNFDFEGYETERRNAISKTAAPQDVKDEICSMLNLPRISPLLANSLKSYQPC